MEVTWLGVYPALLLQLEKLGGGNVAMLHQNAFSTVTSS